jgi:hypothetical protein
MPNRRIGAAAVIVNDEGGLPLVKQTYGRLNWELPGAQGRLASRPTRRSCGRCGRRRGWTSPFLPGPGCDVLGAGKRENPAMSAGTQ